MKKYADLKIAEVITYSRMLDRMNLSIKNGWFDELGRAYIFCSLKDVQEFADCGKNKAVDILKALEAIGLIEKVKGAPGMGTRIYVKNFIPREWIILKVKGARSVRFTFSPNIAAPLKSLTKKHINVILKKKCFIQV